MYADADSKGKVSIMLISEEELIRLIAEISTLKSTHKDYQYLTELEQLRKHLVQGLSLSRKSKTVTNF